MIFFLHIIFLLFAARAVREWQPTVSVAPVMQTMTMAPQAGYVVSALDIF